MGRIQTLYAPHSFAWGGRIPYHNDPATPGLLGYSCTLSLRLYFGLVIPLANRRIAG